MFRHKKPTIHFVGIGGSGMNGLAQILLSQGCQIRGSDISSSEVTRNLEEQGAKVYYGHTAANISKDTSVVVVSSAILGQNPETDQAMSLKIPIIHRAEMLAELMRLKWSVAVAGTHGKTTTTSLLSTLLIFGGYDPTVFVGGRLNSTGTFGKHGDGKWIVAESDESDGSFMKLLPTLAIVTNIDNDHMNHYKDLTTLKNTFLSFINRIPFYGKAILCGDDEHIQEILPSVNRPYITYGFKNTNDYSASHIRVDRGMTSFKVSNSKGDLGEFSVPLYGDHNVLNSLACIATCVDMEMDLSKIKEGLKTFSGVDRRFTFKGTFQGAEIFDDYGHHPTEIKAVLQAAKSYKPHSKLIVCFQPHRFSRTRDVLSQFGSCFSLANEVLLLPIYAAGEQEISGINTEAIASVILSETKQEAKLVSDFENCKKTLKALARPGDLIVCLGAGSITRMAQELSED